MTIQVIGAGLGRTGTASLKLALERIGFGPSYHMGEVLANPHFVPLWESVADGHPDWDALFADYRSTTDYPACNYWRELMAHYPDAKVVLTVRDPESWFESVNATIMSPQLLAHLAQGPSARFMRECVYRDFGDRIHDREFMVDYFRRHVDTVQAEVPAEQLLVFEAEQGWAPLCDFLGVEVPDEPFPRVNSRAETEALVAAMVAVDPTGDGYEEFAQEQSGRLFTGSSEG